MSGCGARSRSRAPKRSPSPSSKKACKWWPRRRQALHCCQRHHQPLVAVLHDPKLCLRILHTCTSTVSLTCRCMPPQGISLEELKRGILGSEGPQSNATQAGFVKFHDDQSTYTGVYARGGPTNVDGNKDLS